MADDFLTTMERAIAADIEHRSGRTDATPTKIDRSASVSISFPTHSEQGWTPTELPTVPTWTMNGVGVVQCDRVAADIVAKRAADMAKPRWTWPAPSPEGGLHNGAPTTVILRQADRWVSFDLKSLTGWEFSHNEGGGITISISGDT